VSIGVHLWLIGFFFLRVLRGEYVSSHLSKIAFSGGKVQVAFRSEARNARSGAVGPDARKASPQRRGVLDVRRRRRRAKPDKADGPTPPALPRIGGGAFKAAQEGAAREAGHSCLAFFGVDGLCSGASHAAGWA
jgi:hypothetical protein